MSAPRHLALVGPTAAGKSALALELARRHPEIEIVSLDSMQVYRRMDVGTAKPTVADRTAVAHHLIDVVDPSDEWSVARTQRMATDAVVDVERRGGRAILVGGTGLYVSAVVDGYEIPGRDPEVRAELERRTATPEGLKRAYGELVRLDPRAAARMEPGNRRRIVRALEVIETSGRPFSSFGPGVHRAAAPALDVLSVGIWADRARLDRRIADRTETMFASGLIDEAAELASQRLSRTASQAIGYAEALALVRGDLASVEVASQQVCRRTTRFARRQQRWFRRDHRIVWFPVADDPESLVRPVERAWLRTSGSVAVR